MKNKENEHNGYSMPWNELTREVHELDHGYLADFLSIIYIYVSMQSMRKQEI